MSDSDFSDDPNRLDESDDRPKAPFKARLTIWLIAGAALAGIALMCITVLVLIAARN